MTDTTRLPDAGELAIITNSVAVMLLALSGIAGWRMQRNILN